MPGSAIAVASGHAGFDLNEILKRGLREMCHEVLEVVSELTRPAVLVRCSGFDTSMAASRDPRVDASVAHDVTSRRLSRRHNNVNVAAFGRRPIGFEAAREVLRVCLATNVKGGRCARRIAKLYKGCTQ